MFGARGIEAQGHDDAVAADLHPVDQQRHQVKVVERQRPPRVQPRLGLRDNASTDRALARAPRGDVCTQRVETPRLLACRHAKEYLVDDAPGQRVGIRARPRRG